MSLCWTVMDLKGTDGVRTRDLRFTRPTPYHLATAPDGLHGVNNVIWSSFDGMNTTIKHLFVCFRFFPPCELTPLVTYMLQLTCV